ERAPGLGLARVAECRRSLGRLTQTIGRALRPAGGLLRRGRARVLLGGLREALERLGVTAGVVVALRQPQARERGGRAVREVLEQSTIAALGLFILFGLEVDVARTRPGAIGERRGRAVAQHGLPTVHRVTGALHAQVAQAALVERHETARVARVAAEEVLVGAGRLLVAALVEALMGDVENGGTHHLVAAVDAAAREQTLFRGDGQAVLALPRIGPRHQAGG